MWWLRQPYAMGTSGRILVKRYHPHWRENVPFQFTDAMVVLFASAPWLAITLGRLKPARIPYGFLPSLADINEAGYREAAPKAACHILESA